MSVGWFPRPANLPPAELRRLVVEASAGTGKTFFLEHRVADLILAGAAIDQILLVTFTEKATAELRTRIRALLARLLSAGPRPADAAGPGWVIDDAARTALGAALAGFDRAAIHTIHGFCQRILIEDAFAGKRLLEQTQIADEIAFDDAFLSALREVFAVAPGPRALLRHALAVGRSVDALRVLLLKCYRTNATITPPFDRAALTATARTVRAALDAYRRPNDFGSLGSAIVGVSGITNGQTKAAAISHLTAIDRALTDIDLGDAVAVLGACASADVGDAFTYLRTKLRKNATAERIYPLLDLCLMLAEVAPSLDAACAHEFLPEITARLAARKQRRGQFDYQDMLALVAAILDGERGDDLAERLRKRHPWAMIDEFQDTDPVQWRIFQRVWLHEDARGLAIVGDPKQAIYSFRGADVATYLAARDQLLAAGALRLDLADNYRSSARIVDTVNALLAGTGEDGFFTGAIGYPVPVRAAAGVEVRAGDGGDGGAAVRVFEIADKLPVAEMKARLYARIGDELERILRGDQRLDLVRTRGDGSLSARPINARDVFVLTRTNAEAGELADELRGRGLPCALFRADYLFKTAEAKAVADVLDAIAAPRDRARLLTAWTTPFFGVPLDRLRELGDLPDTHPLVAPIHEWRTLALQRDYGAMFTRILDDSRVAERALVTGQGARMLANLQHVFELCAAEVARTRPELHDLVRTLRGWITHGESDRPDESDVQRIEEDGDAIQLMTAHRAKGLEAAVVFVVGGNDTAGGGRQDKVRLYVDDAGQRVAHVGDSTEVAKERIDTFVREENQRLCYVAMTRAKVRLYLWQGPPMHNGAYLPVDRALRRTRDRARELGIHYERLGGDDQRPPLPSVTDLLALDAMAEPWPEPAPPAPLASAQIGFAVTSFTQLARAGVVDAIDVRSVRGDPEAPLLPLPPTDLPPGAATGVFLHELLEDLDFAQADTDLATWCAQPSVVATFASVARRHGIDDPAHLDHARRMIHETLTLPIPVGAQALPPLCRATRVAREVEFTFPLPDASGFVTGFIDLLVAWDDQVWVIDYKSNVLSGLGLAAAEDTVEHHYALQLQLYALAARRMLGTATAVSTTLGGVLFWFLRPQLVVARTPSDAELDRWERNLGVIAARLGAGDTRS
ncbi:MAG: UvrD-helicase domain-containing protein [Deltaproteobacteria bacterium]|nr:UvrD-helicase domain-containing protein [Deltaproteobacteria bacterium]